ncbi:uncharacterized protein LOC115270124 [Aedes albopictus]|uniref:Uncharacterized protein n=1 Tax=Aedes albopictus TaxID=7160 RepID=A0ABM1YGE0_AEDAL
MELLERCSNCAELPICDIDELPLPDLSFDETLDLEDLSYASYRQSGDAVDVEELFTVSPALTQPVSLLSDLAQNEEFLLKSFSSDHRISPTLQLPLLANDDDDEETQTEEKITTSKTIPNIAQFFVAGCFDKEEADSQAAASLPTESNARAIEADIATANTMQVDDSRTDQSSVHEWSNEGVMSSITMDSSLELSAQQQSMELSSNRTDYFCGEGEQEKHTQPIRMNLTKSKTMIINIPGRPLDAQSHMDCYCSACIKSAAFQSKQRSQTIGKETVQHEIRDEDAAQAKMRRIYDKFEGVHFPTGKYDHCRPFVRTANEDLRKSTKIAKR